MGQNDPMTFHCKECNIVLGDYNGVCGELECMGYIMCLRVTQNVVVSDEVELALKGNMAHCIYSALKCSGCHSGVGAIIDSTPEHLDMLRGIFLLHKENINCYNLISSSMVKASELSFDLKTLLESIKEVMQQIQAQAYRVSLIEKRLSEMDK